MPYLLALNLFAGSLYAAPVPASDAIQQADAAYAQRSDLTQARAALDGYQQAFAANPESAEVRWKASRTAWWMGDHAESRPDKLRYFQEGIDYAKDALAHDPNSVEAHFWLGANYGSFGETKGVMKSLSLVKPIRQEMAEVNRINDHYDGGGGYRVLGVMDYKVPGIAGGSKKRALEQLNKALAIDPRDPFTNFYLAEYYQVTGKKEESQKQWEMLKRLDVAPELRPEYDMLIGKGKKQFEK